MIRICWWLVDRFSRLLEPAERDAVHGDIAESGETAGRALLDVLGLVIRRQTVLWKAWQPWLALIALVVPVGMLLSLISRRMVDGSAIYIWLYVNNWTPAYLTNPGVRHDLFRDSAGIAVEYLAVLCWSWTGGFLVGSLSRRTLAVNGPLFCLVLLLGDLFGAPQFLRHWLLLPRPLGHSPVGSNAAVFLEPFYRVIFPLTVQTVLVALPSLWGIRHGLQLARLPRLLQAILWGSVTAAVIGMVTQNLVWWQVRTWNNIPPSLPRLPPLLLLALVGPVGYIVAIGCWRTWYRKNRRVPA
jgi:hypothetical protein